MYDETVEKQNVILWLMHNQSLIKEKIAPILETKKALLKTNNIFADEINGEFKKLINRIICTEIGKNLSTSPEIAYVVVESLNAEEYLKW
jgi:hypothetical protein